MGNTFAIFEKLGYNKGELALMKMSLAQLIVETFFHFEKYNLGS